MVFNCLPIAAIVDDKIFCIHGGLSPDLNSMEQIRRILRPTDVPDTGLLCDVLWADPDPNIRGWAESDRGVSFTFGADIVEKFTRKHDFDLIVRAHQVLPPTHPGSPGPPRRARPGPGPHTPTRIPPRPARPPRSLAGQEPPVLALTLSHHPKPDRRLLRTDTSSSRAASS